MLINRYLVYVFEANYLDGIFAIDEIEHTDIQSPEIIKTAHTIGLYH